MNILVTVKTGPHIGRWFVRENVNDTDQAILQVMGFLPPHDDTTLECEILPTPPPSSQQLVV
jgi:hypothetical protein